MVEQLPNRYRNVRCYDSVIGMIKKFSKILKKKDAINHFPAEGKGTLSGVIVEANFKTGLATKITRIINGELVN